LKEYQNRSTSIKDRHRRLKSSRTTKSVTLASTLNVLFTIKYKNINENSQHHKKRKSSSIIIVIMTVHIDIDIDKDRYYKRKESTLSRKKDRN